MNDLDERARGFLDEHAAAAMVTLRRDGTPHVARVAVGLVDGRLWSSGLPSRLRTGHLRRDPRCTLFVYDPSGPQGAWRWLGLETTATILDDRKCRSRACGCSGRCRLDFRRSRLPVRFFGRGR